VPRRTRHDEPDEEPDDWSDGYDAYRDYDPDDPETYPEGVYADDDGDPSIACPYCREEIAEEAVQCPHCGNYLSREDTPAGSSKSRAWVVVMVLALLAAAMWVLAG
jgi:hypothetical protein